MALTEERKKQLLQQAAAMKIAPVSSTQAGGLTEERKRALLDQANKMGIKPATTAPATQKTLLDYAPDLINKGVEKTTSAIKFTGIPKAVGIATTGIGGLLGGAIGGGLETVRQGYRAATGKGFNPGEIKQRAMEVGKDTAGFGKTIGEEGTAAAPFMGLGKIPSAIIAAPTIYEGVKEKDPTKLAIGALSFAGSMGSKGKFVDEAVSDATGALGKKFPKATGLITPKNTLTNAIEKGVKPQFKNVSNSKAKSKYYSQAEEGFRTIRDFEPTFVDDAGEVVVRAPQTRAETLEAIGQVKTKLFNEYDRLAKEAGDAGARFDATPILKKIEKVTNDKSFNPDVRRYALKLSDEVAELQGQSPAVIQSRITDLNNSLQNFYDGRTTKATAQVDASIANALREQLDDQINSLTGANYQGLKNQYGSLKAVEGDVARQAALDARRNNKGLLDFTDVFTGGDLAAGIITMNPALIARGVVGKATKGFFSRLNDPNRAIAQAFDELYAMPARPKAQAVRPPIAGLLPEKAGVGITQLPNQGVLQGQEALRSTPPPNLSRSGIVKDAPQPTVLESRPPIAGLLPESRPMSTINQGRPIPVAPAGVYSPSAEVTAGTFAARKPKAIEGQIVKKTPTNRSRGVATQTKTRPAKTVIKTESVPDLKQEAKKYKSAEEFVKAQGKELYHGTTAGNDFSVFDTTRKSSNLGNSLDQGNNRIYLTESQPAAEYFGNMVQQNKELRSPGLANSENIGLPGNVLNFSIAKNAKIKELTYTPRGEEAKKILDLAKKDGFDAVSFPEDGLAEATRGMKISERIFANGKTPPKTYIILNPDAIKSKSQLTDIWNEAQGKKSAKTSRPIKSKK